VRRIALAVLLLGWQQLGAAATEPVVINVRGFPSILARFWVAQAVEGAARRMRTPECARVFSEFNGPDGRPLAEQLAKLGVGPEEYLLTHVWFYEGRSRPFCDPKFDRDAVTEPGSRVVFICSDQFVRDVHQREANIIHEMLHSLGLGENPPSSREITRHVKRRCG
jgi:hypothetical protein